jgi:hypothetical protein
LAKAIKHATDSGVERVTVARPESQKVHLFSVSGRVLEMWFSGRPSVKLMVQPELVNNLKNCLIANHDLGIYRVAKK